MNRNNRRAGTLIPLLALIVAVAAFAYALRLATPWMEVNRGIFHHLQHDHDEAIAILSEADLKPPNFRPLQHLVASHVEIGQTAEALEILQGVCGENPTWAAPHFEIGLLLLRQGEWNQSLTWLIQALEHTGSGVGDPLSQTAHGIAEATLSLKEDDIHHAMSVLNALPEVPEMQDAINLLRAEGLLRLNRWREAEAPLAEALRFHPENPRAAAMRSLCLAATGKWHEARQWFDIARAESVPLSMPFFFEQLNAQVNLATQTEARGVPAAALSRDDGLAFLVHLKERASMWDAILADINAQPVSMELRHPAIWHAWSGALRARGEHEIKNECITRMFEINPSAHLDPNWPFNEGESRASWSERHWNTIPLPEEADLPEGSGRFGLELENINIHSNATITVPFDAPQAGWYRIITNMSGRSSNGIWPMVEVTVPPTPATPKYVATEWPQFHVTVAHLQEGPNELSLSYVNDLDYLNPDEDRQVRINNIWVEKLPIARTGE